MNGKTYKYIPVQDVVSRYLWLRALTGKSSKLVARELNKLYTEVGPPRVIQSDNGGDNPPMATLQAPNMNTTNTAPTTPPTINQTKKNRRTHSRKGTSQPLEEKETVINLSSTQLSNDEITLLS